MTTYPPGPSSPALIQSLHWLARPVEVMEACASRYGEIFTLHWLGTGHIVFLTNPDTIKEVFTGDPDVLRAGEGNEIVEPLLGKHSLFTLDGPAHLRQRRLLMPPFRGERMNAYTNVTREVADRAIDRWPREVSLQTEMQAITLEVIVRTVFGIHDPDAVDRMIGVLEPLLGFVGSRATDMFTLLPGKSAQRLVQRDLGPWSPWGRFLRLRARVDAELYAEIRRRRAAGTADASVLSLLLQARDEQGEPMTELELRDELMTLLIAGHETTAGGLAWAFENILSNPDIEARVRSELDEVAPDGRVDAESAAKMPYLDAVAKEALRLRPILQIVARRLKAPLRIGGWELPAETVVAPCIYLTQRRADLFPDPRRFDPNRFIDGRPSPYAFLPFGGGIRKCIGAAFALHQMKVVIAAVLSRTDLRLPRPARGAKRRTVTLVPAGATRVVRGPLRPRASSPAPAVA